MRPLLSRRPVGSSPRHSLARDERGASAVEFALLAPLLVMACLATVDVGMAISERMNMDSVLRTGSEGAMVDLGEDEVEALVEDAASESFNVAPDDNGDIGTGSPTDLDVTVDRFCSCPGSGNEPVDCETGSCAGSVEPYLFYRLTAEKTYEPLILPEFGLRGSMLVQVE